MPARTLVVCLLAGAILHGQEPDIRSIHRVTEEQYGRGDYAAARRTVTEALQARTGPVDLHRTGVLLRLLGRADYLLGDFEAAGRSYRAALSSLERAGAAARVHLADTQLDYALVLDIGGPSRDAQRRRVAALAIYEQELGPGRQRTLMAQGEIAVGYLNLRDFVKAESLCREIIGQWEGSNLPPSAHLARAWDTLGFTLLEMKRHQESAVAFRRSLALNEGLFGDSHPVTLEARLGLASAHAAGREFDPANEAIIRAEQVAAASLAADHPMRTMILLTKVKVLRAQGLSAEAKRVEKQVRPSADSAPRKRHSISWGEWTQGPK
jgi:tetratricopeptide (TPR) repeat protein